MSYKEFSSAHGAPGKDGSAAKSKDAPPADRPTGQPDTTKAEGAPAPKS